MMSTPDIVPTAAPSMQTSERRCENADCNVNKLISMVPKRKTTQFIADPTIMDKPMLVNGFTAVFQVDGTSAKLMDIKNPNGEAQNKSIYRIVPNSHVHVVNYVVIDADESYLRKITENDPVTMQKLLTSQKESADQMLKKIMSGQGSSATAAMTTVVSTINPSNTNHPPQPPTQSLQVNSSISQATTSSVVKTVAAPQQVGVTNTAPKSSIKLPVRMHPNLKITAVACAESLNAPTMSPNVSISATGPSSSSSSYITPVPLTNLQTPPTISQTNVASSLNSMHNSLPPIDTVDKPTYDKMQAEINDLRRTVAMLAEAQAKNQLQQPSQSGPTKPAKRPRSVIQTKP